LASLKLRAAATRLRYAETMPVACGPPARSFSGGGEGPQSRPNG